MAININSKELRELLDTTPSSHNIMLSGKHGIGKSQIITKHFEAKGTKVVTLFLGQMSDPGDLIGLPHKNEHTAKTDFMPPYWFPIDNQPVALFLDELNRARPEILQTIMDLALNRKLAGRSLPEGSRIISAVNDGEEYQLTDLDPALVSRFNIYNFTPSVEEWLLWASNADVDQRVLSFIEESPNFLDGLKNQPLEASCLEKSPDRRAWERVSDILKATTNINGVTKKTVAGIVGAKAANKLFESMGQNRIIAPEKALADFDKCRSTIEKYSVHELSILNDSIFRCIECNKQGAATTCEINLMKYIGWMQQNDRREAMAHFCSVFESTTYSKANLFMMSQASKCFKAITAFIKSL